MSTSFWSVVQTESQRESVAVHFLEQQGFETYLPRIKIAARPVPLFPTYLFVRVIDHWYAIDNTIGVLQLLRAGDHPARLQDAIVNTIRSKERDGIVKLPDPRRLQRGDKIRITAGSFEGHFGIYQGMSGKQRERVLLDLLGRKVAVEINKRFLQPA